MHVNVQRDCCLEIALSDMIRYSRHHTERIVFAVIGLAAVATAVPIIVIVGSIFFSGAEAVSWQFLLEMPRDGMRSGGIWPAIIGTIYLVVGTGLISIPLGVAVSYTHLTLPTTHYV